MKLLEGKNKSNRIQRKFIYRENLIAYQINRDQPVLQGNNLKVQVKFNRN